MSGMGKVSQSGNKTVTTYPETGFEIPDLPGNLNALTPEGLIAYVTEMLGSTDGQINEMMASLKERKEKAAWLQHMASEMRQAKHGTIQGEKSKLNVLRDEAQAKVDAAKAAGKSDPEAEKLLDELNKMDKSLLANLTVNGNKDMTDGDNDWLEQKATAIDAQVSELTTGTELDMINLQSLVEQRSHMIAFASKAIASLDDNVKGVIGNIR